MGNTAINYQEFGRWSTFRMFYVPIFSPCPLVLLLLLSSGGCCKSNDMQIVI